MTIRGKAYQMTLGCDAGGRLTSETIGEWGVNRTYITGNNVPARISSTAVGDYWYSWDPNKNKTGETITGAMSVYSSTMGCDDQNRLTTWNRSNGNSQSWRGVPDIALDVWVAEQQEA